MTGGARPRTAEATAARQRTAARRAALRLGIEQLGHLEDDYLVALAAALKGEADRRGLAISAERPAVPNRLYDGL